MKKMIRIRILATLCLFFRRKLLQNSSLKRRLRRLQSENKRVKESMSVFFQHHPPELVRYFTILIFQCWAVNECTIKSQISDQAFAEFLDRLNDFVSASYRFHAREYQIFEWGQTFKAEDTPPMPGD